MPVLELLRPEHAEVLLEFERENRAWFARTVTDRGDAFFADFAQVLAARLAEQEAGVCAFHVLVDDEATPGAVLGRFNLVDLADGTAELGYRLARTATGRGLATGAVRELCAWAQDRYGLKELRAVTARDNAASRGVLSRTGFVPTGPVTVAGRPGIGFVRTLG